MLGSNPVSKTRALEPQFVLALFVLLGTAWTAGSWLGDSRANPLAGAASMAFLGVAAAVIAHQIVFKPLRKLEAAHAASAQHVAALDRLRHAECAAAVGTLTSSVAHELGNPLNVIELRAQLIASGDAASPQEARKNALLIVEQSRRMTSIINKSLRAAPMPPARPTQGDLLAVLHSAVALAQPVAQAQEVTIRLEAGRSPTPITADFDKLLHAVVTLLLNGVQAMPDGGELTVRVRDAHEANCDAPGELPRERICIDVIDRGVGISEEALASVFDPLYSTWSRDAGAGLGLSVAQGIAHQHDGWISVESVLGRGSSFTLHLPKHPPENG